MRNRGISGGDGRLLLDPRIATEVLLEYLLGGARRERLRRERRV